MNFLFPILMALVLMIAGCQLSPSEPKASGCVQCHQGLEQVSPSHHDCTQCHGGDPDTMDENIAHWSMYGPKNPSSPQYWERTCGSCHTYQLQRVQSSLMNTATGMIKNIQLTWEGEDGKLYASKPLKTYGADGTELVLEGVEKLDHLSGELYRKFCALCHVGIESNQSWSASHAAGCAACHFPYNDNATYQGGDRHLQGKWPYSETHAMQVLPENRVCFRCHNRSGRIAMSYEGQNDGNNSLVPTNQGYPGPELISGIRNATSIAPDIHHKRGLECIDCHTSRDIMGDGYAYENMYEQVEIRCEDCHGSADRKPAYAEVAREHSEAVRESQHYQRQVKMGDKMILTSKGRKYSNVFYEDGAVWLVSKRTGERHESKVITQTPEHTIAGHERLECYSCHSRSVAQCYGCHTQYDLREQGRDFIKGRNTPGAFSETEDYRTLYPFPLALNQHGRISPVTPGCQTFVTVVEADGSLSKDSYVSVYDGKQRLRFAPFFGHNIGSKAVSCEECHGNPAFAGFGQHVVEGNSITPTLLCEKSDRKPLDGFLTLEEGTLEAFSAITRENSRPLNAREIRRMWAVNQCLICHTDPKDPIYQKELDYRVLSRCLDRPAHARPASGSH
ncbi:hypothetical protein Selin_2600 [Desulfurispirillum indicum S5]|uniref:Uncharacterized protein n=1 Tax=Desulfurispirillum indicum (strain ATCC BAA-1389 / DSM 22839 / S5) TaxID=653733 RepID=E6W6H6_DESIS|nr:selenite/tellurite reduction operon c-type cytochrome ExtM [Desulfurispirillum indicum]ADU67311.1 hypothetical protein Selin_2600 [Desulfurispirillum indicum S5]